MTDETKFSTITSALYNVSLWFCYEPLTMVDHVITHFHTEFETFHLEKGITKFEICCNNAFSNCNFLSNCSLCFLLNVVFYQKFNQMNYLLHRVTSSNRSEMMTIIYDALILNSNRGSSSKDNSCLCHYWTSSNGPTIDSTTLGCQFWNWGKFWTVPVSSNVAIFGIYRQQNRKLSSLF